ncbi:hypothetical protein [Flavobacterium sp.]|uniref:hypothetical protein n=1 Tax=Flavobacterium sp. TaxID=239 RepID=UPI003A8D94D3
MRTFIIIVFIISSLKLNAQSIVNGGSGQGLVSLVPDNGFEFKSGFKNINPETNLGFWRLRILPERLSTGLQEVKVAFEFSIDKPVKIRGDNSSGGEMLYNPSDFQVVLSGSMNFIIEGQYTDPITEKQYTFNNKKYVSQLGNSTINGGLFTYGPEIVTAIGKLKITQEADPLAAFLSKFKVQVTSIKAVSRNLRGFKDLDNKIGKLLETGKREAENKAQADSYLRQGHVQYGIADYKGAKELYQKAYLLNKDPKTLALVEDADKAILNKAEQERLQKETTEKQAKENNVSQASPNTSLTQTTTKSNNNTASTSSSNQSNKNTASKNTSNSNTTSNSNRKEETTKTYEQMLYEREVYQRQQKEKLQQATNPGGYYMEKSGVNAYFDAQNERIKKEYAEKEAREEREWLARKRREEAEERRLQQEYEERRRKEEIFSNKIKSLNAFLKEHGYYSGATLPNSSLNVNSDKLYYFAYYTDHGSHTRIEDAKLQITNVFAIGRYAYGSWPLQDAIKSEINKLVNPYCIYRGYYTSEQAAAAERNAFITKFKAEGVTVTEKYYEGKNTNVASRNTDVKVDYWGNPVKKTGNPSPEKKQSTPAKKQKLDYWGNPVKN